MAVLSDTQLLVEISLPEHSHEEEMDVTKQGSEREERQWDGYG